ncbi:arylsulfatase B-like [Chironomus tepperi]|uniref:arylsulfatase B-like n=1 Tax=Chironomus tepperi TaxID=113505 RepID=UPI00391FBD3E
MMNLRFSIILIICCAVAFCENSEKPNIILIVADDLGFNDVSFHGSLEIPTPNIDSLCYNGVILNRMYTAPLCSPSRASLITGKNSIKLGMQHYVIPSDEPWALPLNEKLISNYFQDAGYRTALIGKWHLGFYKQQFTPNLRGFSDFFGYLGPYIGYYDHSLIMLDRNYSRGYDMRRNNETENRAGTYATDLFTNEAVDLIKNHDTKTPLFMLLTHLAPHTGNEDKPMEAPEETIKKFSYIREEKRRILAAMVSKLDEGVGKVIEAIHDKGILNNTVILFMSDNGGPTYGIHSTEGSNYPLRGQKGGVWEGACRVPACIYSPLIQSNRRVSNEFMHITDILPTMASIANISINDKSIDGIDQWKTISQKEPTNRTEILYQIESVLGFSGLMIDGWKLVNGSENLNFSGWLGGSGDYMETSFEEYLSMIENSSAFKSLPQMESQVIKELMRKASTMCNKNIPVTKCNPKSSPCLFNIIDDPFDFSAVLNPETNRTLHAVVLQSHPCEMNNLAESYPEKVEFLLSGLKRYSNVMVPSIRKFSDPSCDPIHFNNTWNWWRKDDANDGVVVQDVQEDIYMKIIICIVGLSLILTGSFILFERMKNKEPIRISDVKKSNWKQMTSGSISN